MPQAACSRHGLEIGANTIWIVKIFIVMLYVVAWPVSVVLDRVLGRDIGTVYSQEELKKLIKIHVENPDAQEESGLNRDDGNLLTGALEYKDKEVRDVMTTLDKVYMVEAHTRLTFQVLMDIYKSGFTRIPVYEIDRQNIVGILFTKDLILIDPDDEIEIAAVLSFHGNREGGFVRGVEETTSLDVVFREFKASYLHLLVAYAPQLREDDNTRHGTVHGGIDEREDGYAPYPRLHDHRYHAPLIGQESWRRVTGIITLEDVIEAVIKDEIVDETDNYVDVNRTETAVSALGGANKRFGRRPDPTNFLTLFEHKIREHTKLSSAEVSAITAFLSLNVAEFKKLARFGGVLKKLIEASQVDERGESGDDDMHLGIGGRTSASDDNSAQTGPAGNVSTQGSHHTSNDDGEHHGNTLYAKGKSVDFFTLILQGKVVVYAGSDEFESEVGPWCYLAQKALTMDPYVPDFRAYAHGACRLLVIKRGDYKAAMRAAQVEAMGVGRGKGQVATGVGIAIQGLGTATAVGTWKSSTLHHDLGDDDRLKVQSESSGILTVCHQPATLSGMEDVGISHADVDPGVMASSEAITSNNTSEERGGPDSEM